MRAEFVVFRVAAPGVDNVYGYGKICVLFKLGAFIFCYRKFLRAGHGHLNRGGPPS